MKGLVIVNILFAVIKFAFNFFIIKLADSILPISGFNLLLYIRRTAPLLGNFAQLGFSQATLILMPRRDLQVDYSWYRSALLLMSFVAFICSLFAFFSRDIILPLAVLVIGIDYIIRSLLLARLLILYSNLIELFTIGMPIAVLLILGFSNIQHVLIVNYAICLITLLVSYIIFNNTARNTHNSAFNFRTTFYNLIGSIKFGFPRNMSSILELGLVSLPVLILGASHSVGLNIASNYSRLTLFFLAPVMGIIQTKINQSIGKGLITNSKSLMFGMAKILIPLSIILAILASRFAGFILSYWVPNQNSAAMLTIVEIFTLTIPGSMMYVLLKPGIDSWYARPYSLYVVLLANTAILLIVLANSLENTIASCITVAYSTIGAIFIFISFGRERVLTLIEFIVSIMMLYIVNQLQITFLTFSITVFLMGVTCIRIHRAYRMFYGKK